MERVATGKCSPSCALATASVQGPEAETLRRGEKLFCSQMADLCTRQAQPTVRSILIGPFLLACTGLFAQTRMSNTEPLRHDKLTVEIWSDVVCPFCFIGKREFEAALARFPHRDSVEVVWKSFELDPNSPVRSAEDTYTMLANKYGMSREDARNRVSGVAQRGQTVGIAFNFDAVTNANSFDAHRLIQFAKSKGKGDAIEEALFGAHFTQGAVVSDRPTLVRLGVSVGLDAAELERMLADQNAFADAVRTDEREAQQFGIRGVPFFALDRKYAVSGAQSAQHFSSALEQAWKERPVPEGVSGAVCDPEKADCLPGQ